MEHLTEELMKDMEDEVIGVPQSSDWRVVLTEGIQQQVGGTIRSTVDLCREIGEIPIHFSNQYQ